jgi:hypothetical protein
VRTLLRSSNSYMWLRSSFLSYPNTFLTFQRAISSCLLATIEVVDRPKSYLVDILCVDYPSHQTITCGYKELFSLIPLLSLLVKRTISSCLHATKEIVDGPKSYQVDVLCVDYPSHLTVTCGYEVVFSFIPILSLLFKALYLLVSLPQ